MQTNHLQTHLPAPPANSPCDRDAGETAVARIHTPAGPIDLCGHHLRENYLLLQALGYGVGVNEPVQATPYEIDPNSVRIV